MPAVAGRHARAAHPPRHGRGGNAAGAPGRDGVRWPHGSGVAAVGAGLVVQPGPGRVRAGAGGAVNAELEARLWSLEAERLRPTPPPPPVTPSALAAFVPQLVDDILAADVDGVLGHEPAGAHPGPADPTPDPPTGRSNP